MIRIIRHLVSEWKINREMRSRIKCADHFIDCVYCGMVDVPDVVDDIKHICRIDPSVNAEKFVIKLIGIKGTTPMKELIKDLRKLTFNESKKTSL